MSSTDSLRERTIQAIGVGGRMVHLEQIEAVEHLIEQYGLEQRIDELRNLPIIDGHRMGIAYGDHTPVVDGQYVRDRIRDLGRQKEEL